MTDHQFIFSPGQWIGEGKITFASSMERMRFYTKWMIKEAGIDEAILCEQQVEIEGGEESSFNRFVISQLASDSFEIELHTEQLGMLKGKGVIDAKTIAWEFRGHPDFEGFEVYELQENGDYMLHAEYASQDEFRTIIDGRIWKKWV